jgi:outer membrane receptor protein involved in Fe transport
VKLGLRYRRCALAFALSCMSSTPLAVLGQAPAAPAGAAEAEAETDGGLYVVAFEAASNLPIAGLRLISEDRVATTGESGAAELVVPAGMRAVQLVVPSAGGAGAAIELPPVYVGAGEITQVIVTIADGPKLESIEIEGPEPPADGAPAKPEVREPAAEARAQGNIVGRVLSLESREPVSLARVFVRGQDAEAQTDDDGRFSLALPAGVHTLSVIHTRFSTQTIDNVEVRPAVTTELSVELTPAALALDDFIVTAPHIDGTVASLIDARRESAAATDSIGADDIGRTPASDAAGAAQRVVGATIVDGRYVYVRGLGERYTNARLNSIPLPSPEPDRATVPLDLFPAQIIKSLEIAKTFTPDIPADFAGGSVQIETITIPETAVFQLTLSGAWNSQATLRAQESYEGSSTDWLGFDDGSRQLTDGVPSEYPLENGFRKPDGTRVTTAERDALAPALNSNMATQRFVAPPNMGGSLLAGDSLKLGKDTRLGAVASLSYGRTFTNRHVIMREFVPSGRSREEGDLDTWSDFESDRTQDLVRWGAFGTVTLAISKEHSLSLSGFRSQLADKETNIYRGYNSNSAATLANTQLSFAARALNLLQLHGKHTFAPLAGATLAWDLNTARAARDEPDTRDVVYQLNPRGYTYLSSGNSGRHFFAEQIEDSRGGGLDWTQPIPGLLHDTKLKLGGRVTWRDREFEARRFYFRRTDESHPDLLCGPEFDPRACPARLFRDENVTGEALRLQEILSPGDSYRAGLDVYAAYAMADAALIEQVRLVGGARIETTQQHIVSFNPFTSDDLDDRNEIESTDLLPAAAIIYAPTEQINLRVAASRTLARPQLRELAPFNWADVWGGIPISGNPNLTLTRILNTDVRFEYFPSLREILAASVFYKHFEDPIEPVIVAGTSLNQRTFANAKGASLYGLEFEVRKELAFIAPLFEDFSVNANLTLATSHIEVEQTAMDQSGIGFLTNTERAMVHQAPYVVNLMLDYETPGGTMLRLLYNVSGPRLVAVGTGGMDDGYVHPIHQLDFVAAQRLSAHFMLRLSVRNILDARWVVTQGKENAEDRVTEAWHEGVTATLSLRGQL